MLPTSSDVTRAGLSSAMAVAGPVRPPVVAAVPVPAMVVMMPVVASIFLMALLPLSAIIMFPSGSTQTPQGPKSFEDVAGPPSPVYPTEDRFRPHLKITKRYKSIDCNALFFVGVRSWGTG